MDIELSNCLEPLHLKFPSLKVKIDFKDQILMSITPHITKDLKDVMDNLMIQMGQAHYLYINE
jgi:hypothetical protein